jgi:2-polyprenyl-6-methoxyphenol hydroxylase-like FAD-dependent oxidoreductase
MGRHAIIAGGSLGGLMTAILLRRQGWSVDIFEKVADDLADRGGGITTQDRTWAIVTAAGLDGRDPPGVRLNRRMVFAADGSVIDARDVDQIVTSWDTLYRLLRQQIPDAHYHRGQAVSAATEEGNGVRVTFEGGHSERGDVLIAADGAGSAIRGERLPQVKPVYANYIAWRGLVAEADLEPIARETLAGAFSFCQPPGEQMLSYTIPGADGEEREGERRHNFVWYRPAEPQHALPDLLTDDDGKAHHPNIPPPKIRQDVITAMRDDADRLLSPAYASLVRSTKHPFIQPIYDHIAPQFAFGHVALLGDAAAQARPHVGAGTTKAFEDAAALADSLAVHDDVPIALKAYEAARLGENRKMVEHGRWLGRHLDPLHGRGGEDQTPGTLLGKTARYGS